MVTGYFRTTALNWNSYQLLLSTSVTSPYRMDGVRCIAEQCVYDKAAAHGSLGGLHNKKMLTTESYIVVTSANQVVG